MTITPETFYDGPQGGPDGPTPVDAEALNDMWAAIERVLLYQLTPRSALGGDTTANVGEMVLVDTSGGDRHITAPVATTPGSWGVRHVGGANKVIITAVGQDVFDETDARTWTLSTPGDDAVFSFVSLGRFTLARQRTQPLPATATGYGLVQLGSGDLVGPANAITVPGKENVGVAANLLTAHRTAADPHGDRAWAQQTINGAIGAHVGATDPHGDRGWATGQFVPRSWFDGAGNLLPSHTGALSIINTSVVGSQAAMLALTAQTGDVAIRTDAAASGGQRTYILQGSDPTVLANWTVMPALGVVSSVRGSANGTAMTGDVVLGYSDVGAPSATDSRIVNSEVTTRRSTPTGKVANGYIGADASGNVPTGMSYAATTTGTGVIQLSGDLGGTYNNILVLNKMPLITPNATIYTGVSNPHTPVQGEVAQYNANAANIAQVLPAAPTGTTVTVLEVKNLTPIGSTNTVTFSLAGSDTLEYVSGSTLVLRFYGEVRRLIGYQGNWTVDGGVNPVSGLDTRYLQIANTLVVPPGGTTGQTLTKTGNGDGAYAWATPSGGGSGSVVDAVNNVSASGSAVTLPDVTTATLHDVTLTANCTFTFPAAGAGKSFTLVLRQDGTGGRSVTWPTVAWPAATLPVLTTSASRTDVLTFVAIQTGPGTGSYLWSGSMAAKDVR